MSPVREKGTSQRMATATRLPAVPGATGGYPAPPAVAMMRARRSAAGATWLGPLANELVAFDLDDAHTGKRARLESPAQVHDAVDLGGLAGRAAFPREGGILAATIDEDVALGADERLVALPGDAILKLLHGGRALGGHLGIDLIGELDGRRAFLRRIREDAETVEADVGQELQEVLEGDLGLAGKADEHRRADGQTGDCCAKVAEHVLHPPRRHRPPHRAEHAVVAVLHRHV